MIKEYEPEERPRMTEEQAREILTLGVVVESTTPVHLLDNEDGSFSIWVHPYAPINCPYCHSQGDARGKPDIEAVPYRGV